MLSLGLADSDVPHGVSYSVELATQRLNGDGELDGEPGIVRQQGSRPASHMLVLHPSESAIHPTGGGSTRYRTTGLMPSS